MPSIITSNTIPTVTARTRSPALRPPTRPERDLHELFDLMGLEGLRREARDLPGTPDLVCDEARVAGFAHGCFWHHHTGCHLACVPQTRPAWWRAKFTRNQERDERVRTALIERGWRVVTLWECAGRAGCLRGEACDALDLLHMGAPYIEVSALPAVTPLWPWPRGG